MYADTRYLFLLIRFKQLSLFFQHPVFEAKADAKVQPFSILAKYFFKKKSLTNGTCCQSALPTKKKFCSAPTCGHAKRCKWAENHKKKTPIGQKRQKPRKNTPN